MLHVSSLPNCSTTPTHLSLALPFCRGEVLRLLEKGLGCTVQAQAVTSSWAFRCRRDSRCCGARSGFRATSLPYNGRRITGCFHRQFRDVAGILESDVEGLLRKLGLLHEHFLWVPCRLEIAHPSPTSRETPSR